jgi:pimeloyl-ACP methyl ester carboxylesterase
VSGTGLTLDWFRKASAESYDRAFRPDGAARQLRAVRSYGDRLEALAKTVVPTTIVHGRDDVVVDLDSAVALARAMPTADLHLYADIGHEIPPTIWPDLVSMVARNAQRRRGKEALRCL